MSLIVKTVSNKGKDCIFVNHYRFSNCYTRKNGTKYWRCSCGGCPMVVIVDESCSTVLESRGCHNHAAVLGDKELQVGLHFHMFY